MGFISSIINSVGTFFSTFISTIPPFLKVMFFLFILVNLIAPITSFFLGGNYVCTTGGELYDISIEDARNVFLNQTDINNLVQECEQLGYDIPNYETNVTVPDNVVFVDTLERMASASFGLGGIFNRWLYEKNREIHCNNIVIMGGEEQDLDFIIKNLGNKIEQDENIAVGLTCSANDIDKVPTIGLFGMDVLDVYLWNAFIVLLILGGFALKWYHQF